MEQAKTDVGCLEDHTRLTLDRMELVELANRYGRALDRCDWAAFEHVFAEDAEADYSKVVARTHPDHSTLHAEAQPQGRLAIVAWLQAARSNGEPLVHFMTNHIIDELDGDHARTWHYVHERQGAYGWYEIHAVRVPQGWRIARLVLDLVPRSAKVR